MKLINLVQQFRMVITVLTILLFANKSFAQDAEAKKSNSKNAVKLNLFYFVFDAMEVSYDRNLPSNFAVGFSYSQYFTDEYYHEFPYRNFVVNLRSYFSRRQHQGFYLEYGLGGMSSIETESFYSYNEQNPFSSYRVEQREVSSVASNLVVGGKFVRKGGFLGELELGVVKPHSKELGDYPYPKAAIRLGYTF